MASLTFYQQSGQCANGLTYSQNRRVYGYFCACNRYGLGDTLKATTRGGRSLLMTNVDRIGHGSDCDVDTRSARVLMGPKYRVIGRIQVRLSRIRRARKGRHR